tara:strand:- start:15 stop:206 length:192 start_codon:yes stop_codon:yes gene_type:complete
MSPLVGETAWSTVSACKFSDFGYEIFRRAPNSFGKKVKFLNSQIDFAPLYLAQIVTAGVILTH